MIKIGIDEAGRGPWAGPVYASLVILNEEQEKLLLEAGITDSKKLTEKKREALFTKIIDNCIYSKVKYLSAEAIDQVGIYKATIALIYLLVEDAVSQNNELWNQKVLIDGIFPGLEFKTPEGKIIEHECIIKGDAKEAAISAASILAKVKRDLYMKRLDERHSIYQFSKHKGYGTKLHMEILEQYGPCNEHRTSFTPIKKFLSSN